MHLIAYGDVNKMDFINSIFTIEKKKPCSFQKIMPIFRIPFVLKYHLSSK